MGHPTCIIEGLACWLTLCILEEIICNSTNSVQISFIETLKLIVFSWTIWWCYWQNMLMINEKNIFLTVSWLGGLLSAEIFISIGEWGVQMPPLTSENSYFLRSGPQGATLVMIFNSLNFRLLFMLTMCKCLSIKWYWVSLTKISTGYCHQLIMPFLHDWSLGLDNSFHLTLYWSCDYLSMLGLKLMYVSKRTPIIKFINIGGSIITTDYTEVSPWTKIYILRKYWLLVDAWWSNNVESAFHLYS